jgi:hypothetical protein
MAIRQVAEMHLNERLEKSREAIGQQLAVGSQKVSSAYNRLWTEMEAMREAQRKRQEEQRALAEKEGRPVDTQGKCTSPSSLHFLPTHQAVLMNKNRESSSPRSLRRIKIRRSIFLLLGYVGQREAQGMG